MSRGEKKHWGILFLLLIVFVWLIFSYFNEGLLYILFNGGSQGIIDYINSFGTYAYLIFILVVILEVVVAPVPPLILYVVAGVLFGGLYGGVLVLVGNIIGSYIDFKIARNFIKNRLDKKISGKLRNKFNKYFEKYGALSIFILRVNPLTTSDMVSYLSGLTNIRTYKFISSTALGLIPLIFVQTYLGDGIIQDSNLLMSITILFSIVYLIVFIYLILLSLFGKKQ